MSCSVSFLTFLVLTLHAAAEHPFSDPQLSLIRRGLTSGHDLPGCDDGVQPGPAKCDRLISPLPAPSSPPPPTPSLPPLPPAPPPCGFEHVPGRNCFNDYGAVDIRTIPHPLRLTVSACQLECQASPHNCTAIVVTTDQPLGNVIQCFLRHSLDLPNCVSGRVFDTYKLTCQQSSPPLSSPSPPHSPHLPGHVRLSAYPSGTVEVWNNGEWGTLCGDIGTSN